MQDGFPNSYSSMSIVFNGCGNLSWCHLVQPRNVFLNIFPFAEHSGRDQWLGMPTGCRTNTCPCSATESLRICNSDTYFPFCRTSLCNVGVTSDSRETVEKHLSEFENQVMQESEHFRFKVFAGLILTLTLYQLKEKCQSTWMAGFAKCWFLTRDAQNKHLPEFHKRVMQEPAPNIPTVASYQSMK